MNLENHPCFNEKARHQYARVHLPVAPRCNVQCNFCLRDFDCMNESRPGVTTGVLTPQQALGYLKETVKKIPQTQVVGIAGPGDPFANPVETLDTLTLVRQHFPDMILCVATNGLNLLPYVEALAALEVSHVTITINGVLPEVVEKVYAWMRYEKRTQRGAAAADHLIKQQLEAIERLAALGILVKVNSILIPGVNDEHIPMVARVVSERGAKIFNVMPLVPVPGTPFGKFEEPSAELVKRVRGLSGFFLPQMGHCSRCRADAAGMIGAPQDPAAHELIQKYQGLQAEGSLETPKKASGRVAVASMEGALVNLHLGQAPEFLIYEKTGGGYQFREARTAPPAGGGDERWNQMAQVLGDCAAVFVSGAGERPQKVLEAAGVLVYTVEGVISEVLEAFDTGRDMGLLIHRQAHGCSLGCRGTGGGCG